MSMVLYLRQIENEAALRSKANDPDAFFEYLFEADDAEGKIIDFDKAWQALHHVLTGSGWEASGPLAFLLDAGEDIGEDGGYGPTRLASPSEVRAFRDALMVISDAELRSRYDPKAMAKEDVYIAETLAEEGEEGWNYVFQSVPALRAFLDRCVETGSSVAMVLS